MANKNWKLRIPYQPKGECNCCKKRPKIKVGLCEVCHIKLLLKHR